MQYKYTQCLQNRNHVKTEKNWTGHTFIPFWGGKRSPRDGLPAPAATVQPPVGLRSWLQRGQSPQCCLQLLCTQVGRRVQLLRLEKKTLEQLSLPKSSFKWLSSYCQFEILLWKSSACAARYILTFSSGLNKASYSLTGAHFKHLLACPGIMRVGGLFRVGCVNFPSR